MKFLGGFTLSEVLNAASQSITRPANPEKLPQHFKSLDDPGRGGPHSLIIVGANVRLEIRKNLQAALILAEAEVDSLPESVPVIKVKNARRVLMDLIRSLSARIDPGNSGSSTGEGTVIEPGAVVNPNCVIGKNCLIQSGAVIGCAGFGFVETEKGLELMPHLAGVRIGDNCFIGANTVIAAGVLHSTEIGDGCKLDTHVQIAHNVILGRNCLLASQAGIAGSSRVGDNLRMGGAASIAGHLHLGNNVSIAAKSGVTKDLADGAVVAGFPALPIGEWRKQQVFLRKQLPT